MAQNVISILSLANCKMKPAVSKVFMKCVYGIARVQVNWGLEVFTVLTLGLLHQNPSSDIRSVYRGSFACLVDLQYKRSSQTSYIFSQPATT